MEPKLTDRENTTSRSGILQDSARSGLCFAIWITASLTHEWFLGFLHYRDGVDLLYLPHSLRIALVLAFGLSGVLGVCLATATLILFAMTPDFAGSDANLQSFIMTATQVFIDKPSTLASLILQALASGCCGWLALRILVPGRQASYAGMIMNLDLRTILSVVTIASVINSGVHVGAWLLLDADLGDASARFSVMLTGDVLGGVLGLVLIALSTRLFAREGKMT